MVRIKATGRKSTGSQRPAVWHRLLIAAADLGSWEALLAGLEAEEEWVSLVWYRVHRKAEERHPAADVGVDASTLPFPLTSSFGLLPYAAFRGHKEIVAGFCAAGFEAAGTARVRWLGPASARPHACPCAHLAAGASSIPLVRSP